MAGTPDNPGVMYLTISDLVRPRPLPACVLHGAHSLAATAQFISIEKARQKGRVRSTAQVVRSLSGCGAAQVNVTASYLEIYNENLRDLLSTAPTATDIRCGLRCRVRLRHFF